MARTSWDQYFMEIARVVASRGTCSRKQVGAVIVSTDRVPLSTGYNGSLRGLPHCTDIGCLMQDGHCVRTVHAEANALVQAARHGARVVGATIYCTALPCWPCFKLIANAGIKKVVYAEAYRPDQNVLDACACVGVHLEQLGV